MAKYRLCIRTLTGDRCYIEKGKEIPDATHQLALKLDMRENELASILKNVDEKKGRKWVRVWEEL